MITTWNEVYAYICGLIAYHDYGKEQTVIYGDGKPLFVYADGVLRDAEPEERGGE